MRVLAWLALCLAVCHGTAGAESFPSRGLRIIVPFGPGTGSDVLARTIGAKLGEALVQAVTVENREGAGGLIGTRALLSLPADGHAMMMAANPFVVSPLLYDKPPYDVERDFVPVAKVAVLPNVLLVAADLPAKSVRELIALAKARPGVLNYASSGKGTPSQLEIELLKATYELDMVEVAYKNTAQAMTDLIAGQVNVYYPTLPAALPHIKSGRVRALAVGGAKRSPAAPDVPTMAEALDLPGYEAHTWYGFVVAAGTPAEALKRLRGELAKAMQSAEVRERVGALGAEVLSGGGDEFARQMRVETLKWSRLIRKLGLKAD